MTRLLLALILVSTPAYAMALPKALRVQVASESLGFSGAILTVRSVQGPTLREALRTVFLKLPNGRVRSIRLKRMGGLTGRSNLNLYHVEQDSFRLVGPYDCVSIDPIRGNLARCDRARACASSRSFLGRYDWMNGFDRPRGRFGFRFRFLPAYDVGESDGC